MHGAVDVGRAADQHAVEIDFGVIHCFRAGRIGIVVIADQGYLMPSLGPGHIGPSVLSVKQGGACRIVILGVVGHAHVDAVIGQTIRFSKPIC